MDGVLLSRYGDAGILQYRPHKHPPKLESKNPTQCVPDSARSSSATSSSSPSIASPLPKSAKSGSIFRFLNAPPLLVTAFPGWWRTGGMANDESRSEPAVAGMSGGGMAGAGSLWLGGCSWMMSAPVVVVRAGIPCARGEPTGVRDSMGGGVNASMSGRSGSAEAESWRMPFPFGVGSNPGLPWIGGEGSADRPRMIPSSTSRFLASMVVLRVTSSKCWDCSPASAVLFVSRSFSRPSTSARRALMLSETAPSALARDLSRELRRAACTGGVGVGVFGSVSLSYSRFAVEAAPVAATTAFETAI